MTFVLLFLGLLVLILGSVPIAVALGVVALTAMFATGGISSLPNLALVLFDGATSFPLIAIPLFILAGAIMNATGISRRLIAFASALVGFIRGGLAMVSISASLFFAEISVLPEPTLLPFDSNPWVPSTPSLRVKSPLCSQI